MLLQDFLPAPALRDHVRLYRLLRVVFDRSADIPCKAYTPRPENVLSFYPRDTEVVEYPGRKATIRKVRSALIGQQSIITNRHIGQDFFLFQVIFQPGGLYRLTGIPSCELHNQYIDAESVFSAEICRVNERLSSTDSIPEMTLIVEDFLFHLLRCARQKDSSVDVVGQIMLAATEPQSLDWLARASCLCNKQFERTFQERIGINPKYFARIVRFDRAFRMKNKHPHKDWQHIAFDCGYYDYQHLVRDYKEFTQMTPTAFYLQDSRAPERTFGLSET